MTMTSEMIRSAYLTYMHARGHVIIEPAGLRPGDPSTLFTGSGMQPLLPYLLGETHAAGDRLVDSQPCVRSQDIDEVGDNRHTTFFEMLGNGPSGRTGRRSRSSGSSASSSRLWGLTRTVFM